MSHVDLITKSFTWAPDPSTVYYFSQKHIKHSPSKLLRNYEGFVDISLIIQFGWDKQDFLNAIECWKSLNYEDYINISCIKDWEDNLDKYLSEGIIKSIIE